MNDRIQEIRDRQAAATPGPWTYSRWAPGYVVTDDDKFDVVASVVEYREDGKIESKFCGEKSLANREFIAHAPDDIAYLLSEVERLQSQITEMEYPKAMGRDVTYGGWILDYQFLHDVEMEISKSVFWEECPSMEGIELALLTAQEVMKRRSLSHLKGYPLYTLIRLGMIRSIRR